MGEDIVKRFRDRTDSILASAAHETNGIRANKPHPQLVEDISVSYLGSQLSIKQLGTISIQPPRTLQVSAWDAEGAKAIAGAIEEAGRGLSASVDGTNVYVKLPELSQERRAELIRIVKSIIESFKIQVRAARDEANRSIERDAQAKTITEDDKFTLKKKVQEATDKANGEMEALLKRKVREIGE